MPSTYSPNLRIELIAPGEQTGSWGSTTNTNLGTLIEAGISGYVTVLTTGANYPLTANNGAPDEARNMIVDVNTTYGANFNIFVPPVEKFYVLRNSSSYDMAVYCSTVTGNTTPAGTSVTIPSSSTTIVFSDGTNVNSALSYLLGNAATATTAVNATNATNATNLTGSGTISATATGTTQAEKTANTTMATTAFVDRLRSLTTPQTGSSGTLTTADRGALVQASGTITVPASTFAQQDVVTIVNTSGANITIAQGTGLTMYLAGSATTGNRILGQRGIATVTFLSATTAIIVGGGLS